MSIEVKQLIVNSSVSSDDEKEGKEENEKKAGAEKQSLGDPCTDLDEVKADIMAECRRLIKASLETVRER